MKDTLDRQPESYEEEKDERWIRTLSSYEPKTPWGDAYRARLYPKTHRPSVNTRTNPTLAIIER